MKTFIVTPVLVVAGPLQIHENDHSLMTALSKEVFDQITVLSQTQSCTMVYNSASGFNAWWELQFQNKFPKEQLALIPVVPDWGLYRRGGGVKANQTVLTKLTADSVNVLLRNHTAEITDLRLVATIPSVLVKLLQHQPS